MKDDLKQRLFYLLLAAISTVSITGAAVYYGYALNWLGVTMTLLLSALGVWLFARLLFKQKKDSLGPDDIAEKFIADQRPINWKKIAISFAWTLPYFILLSVIFYWLFSARTEAALTSPWQVVSANFFIGYLLATAYLFWLIINDKRGTIWLIIIHYFLSFSVLWIVFQIGFGYDPFIHQATVGLIDKQGAVFPKTPYYLGQYSLVLIAHKLFAIPIIWADKLLVPLLAALTLPPTILLFFKKYLKNSASSIQPWPRPASAGRHLALLALLILPFSIFTLTVPQNLAYLFLLLSILISLFANKRAEIILSFLLAGAALVTHPVAGVPAVLFALAMLAYRQPGNRFCFAPKNSATLNEVCLDAPRAGVLRIKTSKIIEEKYPHPSLSALGDLFLGKNIFYGAIYLLTATVLPVLFYLSNRSSSPAAGSDSAASGFSLPGPILPRQENILLNFIYLFLKNEWLILIILVITAAYAIYRWRTKFPRLAILGGMAASLLIAYFITSKLNFSFLISYERGDYAQRILFDAFILIIPILALLMVKIVSWIMDAQVFIKYSWLAFLIILIAISFYGSYPRVDNYYNSHGFSTGTDDLAAINWIAQDASSTPYVVLADQQVSVGALWTFGFSHYYKNDIYFYPIPTGGPLYRIYLDMVYQKPDRATARQAADLTGAATVYFVINKYWADFDKIVEQAKIDASSYQNINNGEIYIFKYSK
jgi:hypothetical protein